MIEESRGNITALHKFRSEEVIKLEEYLKRDLFDASQFLEKTEKELKYWLDFDVEFITREFWNNLRTQRARPRYRQIN
jgi:hypothetical protein